MPLYSSYQPSRLLPGTEQWRHLCVYYCLVGGLAIWVVHTMGTRLPIFYSTDNLGHRLVQDYIRNTSHRLHHLKTWDTQQETPLKTPGRNVSLSDQEGVPDLINMEEEVDYPNDNETSASEAEVSASGAKRDQSRQGGSDTRSAPLSDNAKEVDGTKYKDVEFRQATAKPGFSLSNSTMKTKRSTRAKKRSKKSLH